MDTTLEKLKKYFPALPPNAIAKIYHARCERLRLLMNHGISEDIRWLIESKVRLSGESFNSFISYMPGTSKSTFAKKRRVKRLKVCHWCARWTCNAQCRSLGMVSVNHEDRIQFIKDGLSKGPLDNLLLTLETHPSGDVYRAIHDLWPYFHNEHARYSLGNLTKKDNVCQFLRKLDGKLILDPWRSFKPFLDVKPKEDVSHNHNYNLSLSL